MSRASINQHNNSSPNSSLPDQSRTVKKLAPAQSPLSTTILRRGCLAVAFLLPLKLSLTYIVLTPLILYWCYIDRSALRRIKISSEAQVIAAPLLAFIAVALLSGAVGVSPLHSLPALGSLIFFVLTIPIFAGYAQPTSVSLALVAGQSIAAFHSLIDALVPSTIPRLFLGKVTESGQLAITIPIVLGLLLLGIKQRLLPYNESAFINRCLLPACAGIITATITLLGFQSNLSFPAYISAGLAAVACICIYIVARRSSQATPAVKQQAILLVCSLPLLTCALLVNLKRGPWLGVSVGVGVLVFTYARRLIIPLACIATIVAVGIAPIRERLLASYSHFTIEGGRSTIWRIGAELLSEYPLGIGYHNSGVLREFAPEIPSELKHFHNNLLNIATETGWLGVAIFLWLLFAAVTASFSNRREPLFVAFGAALISWQVAGLVEYNFGDSEVTIMVWIILGMLLGREIERGAGANY